MPDGRRADPEAQAGIALRQLRLARNWSQEEVAVRMTAYGYDFHQTTVAKIEAAQRPLRVRELADFAALYGVEPQDLIYAPTRTLPEIDQELADVAAQLDRARTAAAAARGDMEAALAAARAAEAAYQSSAADVAILEGRRDALKADREKFPRWEPDSELSFEEGDNEAGQRALGREVISTTSIGESGPTVLRIFLGTHLRRLREASGITREEAAGVIRSSGSKLSRLELGRSGIKERDAADLLSLYGVTDESEVHKFLDLVRQSNVPSWWQRYSDILPSWFETYIGLEMAAAEIKMYEAQHVPELLQTEEYSTAIVPWNDGDFSAKEVDRKSHLRAIRKQRFLGRSNPARLQVVLDEAVLRRQVGGQAVMSDQLEHIVEIAKRPNITIQVLPLSRGSHPVEGSFRILQFMEGGLPEIVYIEQLASALYLDKSEQVDPYRKSMQQLIDRTLTPDETTLFLQKLLVEYRPENRKMTK